ncbi:MAG: hypothetical protein MNPFHGCM_02925 [Gemmatimonadaceae bacterium]|nr:hypothetical protein [Gemmatimonadaceae bacterium]
MTALTRFFFRERSLEPTTAAQTIAWWESRRLPFNMAVGATGLITLAAVNLLVALPPHANILPWQANLIAPAVYGTLANIAYTSGWMAELGIRRWLGDEVEPAGPALFRYGFAFSIGLTLLPTGLALVGWLARISSVLFFE